MVNKIAMEDHGIPLRAIESAELLTSQSRQ
jgi:hypothetical protein